MYVLTSPYSKSGLESTDTWTLSCASQIDLAGSMQALESPLITLFPFLLQTNAA